MRRAFESVDKHPITPEIPLTGGRTTAGVVRVTNRTYGPPRRIWTLLISGVRNVSIGASRPSADGENGQNMSVKTVIRGPCYRPGVASILQFGLNPSSVRVNNSPPRGGGGTVGLAPPSMSFILCSMIGLYSG